MDTHGTQYQDVVNNLNTLNTDVAGLKDKVDVEQVSTAISAAADAAEAAANGYTDEQIEAEVLRADGKYEEKGVAAGLVDALAAGAVAANATAISGLQGQVGTGTVDSRIETAKGEAISAAGTAADQKIAALKLEETYEKVGVAAGLALSGKIPFASTFAMFAAGRAYEQVRNSIGYPHLNVKIGATHAGITVGEDGATHQCNEDIALMRTSP